MKFGLDGRSYEIDLSATHEKELRQALEKYVAAARQVAGQNVPGRWKYGTGPARRETRHIREWLRSQGVDISGRGRIPVDLMNRYNAAH